ncbi:MAG: hypothetical protein M0030_04570 [Actinomycetota bacterium]|nr:hypothetical protein [Actinomycetota bacterium]
MAKMTKEERAELEAKLAADDDEPDDDPGSFAELWNGKGDGVRLPLGHGGVKTFLKNNFGIDLDPPPAKDDDKPGKKDSPSPIVKFSRGRAS